MGRNALLACLSAFVLAGDAAAQDLELYTDTLARGWKDWSWAIADFNSTERAYSGALSVKVPLNGPEQRFEVNHGAPLGTSSYTDFSFYIHGGGVAGRQLRVAAVASPSYEALPAVAIDSYIQGGAVAAGEWRRVTIPLADLKLRGRAVGSFRILNAAGTSQAPFYLDDLRLVSQGVPLQVNVTVDAARPIRTVNRRAFGVNTGMWDEAFKNPETVPLLKAIGVRTMRFPGGSSSNQYRWRTHKVENSDWIPAVTFDQFAATARAVGAKPFITVNYGSGTAQEAADWVHYANVVKGYGIEHWEVGNEVFGIWEYDTHKRPHDPYTYALAFADYRKRMKAADPTIKVGIPVALPGEIGHAVYTDHPAVNPRTGGAYHGWTAVVLSTLASIGVLPDFVTYDNYTQVKSTENDAVLLQTPEVWQDIAITLRQLLLDYLGPAGAKVTLESTEANSVPGGIGKQTTSLVSGLFLADMLGSVLKTEFTGLTWFDFRNNDDDSPFFGGNNSTNLYGWRPYGDYGLVSPANEPYPAYQTAKLLTHFMSPGDSVLPTTSDFGLLSAHALKRADGSFSLLIVNKHPTASLSTQFEIAGCTPAPNALVYEYGRVQDEAARTGRGRADPNTWWFRHAGKRFQYTFAPYSVTVFQMGAVP